MRCSGRNAARGLPWAAVDQSLGGMMVEAVELAEGLEALEDDCQAPGAWCSHSSVRGAAPQGPLRRRLAQRVTGQMPPKVRACSRRSRGIFQSRRLF